MDDVVNSIAQWNASDIGLVALFIVLMAGVLVLSLLLIWVVTLVAWMCSFVVKLAKCLKIWDSFSGANAFVPLAIWMMMHLRSSDGIDIKLLAASKIA